jgi:hypothetical protein
MTGFRFRPTAEDFKPHGLENLYRYAEGRWIEDDGEPDLAFATVSKQFPYQPHLIVVYFDPQVTTFDHPNLEAVQWCFETLGRRMKCATGEARSVPTWWCKPLREKPTP